MLIHLLELRRRAVYVASWFVGLFGLFFFIANDIFQILVYPLVHLLPKEQGLVATQITSSVFTPLKVAADTALLLSIPFALYQFWLFISPGLYKKEQKHLRGLISLSLALFLCGSFFCFFVVLPFMLQFFISALPKDVRLMPDMASSMEFITQMLIVFGLCFQVPLICLLIVRIKITDVSTLKTIRPYIIVAAFILGMLLTPPDVLSQIMLALPLCALYELGIILALFCA